MQLERWPAVWFERRAGDRCPKCEQGRVDHDDYGVRFVEDPHADVYLQRRAPTPGYSVAVFRGRHVADLTEMTADEIASFWSSVARAAEAIGAIFQPVHINYQVLGNEVPHVHCHIVPRHDPDPAPLRPLPSDAWDRARTLDDAELRVAVGRLRGWLGER